MSVSEVMHYFSLVAMPIIIYGGLLGNVFALFLICNSRLKKYASSQFLAILAILDAGFLLTIQILWLEALVQKPLISTSNEFCCKFFMFFTQFCDFSSVWMMVVVSVERYAMLRFPVKTERHFTVRATRIVIAIILLIGIAASSWVLVVTEVFLVKNYGYVCDVIDDYESSYIAFNTLDSTLCCFVPSPIILIFNLMSAHRLWQIAEGHDEMKPRVYFFPKQQTTGDNVEFGETKRKQVQFNTGTKEKQHTKMLVLVSTLFVLLNLPSYVLRMVQQFDKPVQKEIVQLANLLWYLHHAITFYVYTLYSKNARSELVVAAVQFKCCCTPSKLSAVRKLRLTRKPTAVRFRTNQWNTKLVQYQSADINCGDYGNKEDVTVAATQVKCLIRWNPEDSDKFPKISMLRNGTNFHMDHEQVSIQSNSGRKNIAITLETIAEVNK